MAEFDLPGLGSLGAVGLLMMLVFRTLWSQGDGWKDILEAERLARTNATLEAEHLRKEAEAIREELDELKKEVKDAHRATQKSERAHRETRDELQRTKEQLAKLIDYLSEHGLAPPDWHRS